MRCEWIIPTDIKYSIGNLSSTIQTAQRHSNARLHFKVIDGKLNVLFHCLRYVYGTQVVFGGVRSETITIELAQY